MKEIQHTYNLAKCLDRISVYEVERLYAKEIRYNFLSTEFILPIGLSISDEINKNINSLKTNQGLESYNITKRRSYLICVFKDYLNILINRTKDINYINNKLDEVFKDLSCKDSVLLLNVLKRHTVN